MPKTIFKTQSSKIIPSKWDLLAILLIFSVLFAMCLTAGHLGGAFNVGEKIYISLSPWYLPSYAGQTILRMFIALFFAFVFSLIIGKLAAKNERARKIILPIIDILQSVPILGYLSILIILFISLFPGSLWGPQFAAIFAVFTSQVWNMTLSFYQSLRTIPKELNEATDMYQLSDWQKFWKLEVPFAMPGLLWNAMMSMSGGWFFVVASEAITVGGSQIMLPGIGSYIQTAILASDTNAMVYAVLAMLIVIILYDQLLFRPLVAWSEKFSMSDMKEDFASSWFLNVLNRSPVIRKTNYVFIGMGNYLVNLKMFSKKINYIPKYHIMADKQYSKTNKIIWYFSLTVLSVLFIIITYNFIYDSKDGINFYDTLHVFLLGFYTGLRVFILIILCSFIWLPVGIWVGLRPKVAQVVQPIAQILAAFPANLFFPIAVMLIIHFDLNFEIWCAPLMVLGTQWYILFNVIAGASTIPYELKLASHNLQLSGLKKWFKFLIPAVFPFYVTGAIAAAGGSWNASIVAEFLQWGNEEFIATGLGSYITENTASGDLPKVALGVIVMCLWVTLINRMFWRRLYNYAETKFRMN